MKLAFVPSTANFVLVNVGDGAVFQEMLEAADHRAGAERLRSAASGFVFPLARWSRTGMHRRLAGSAGQPSAVSRSRATGTGHDRRGFDARGRRRDRARADRGAGERLRWPTAFIAENEKPSELPIAFSAVRAKSWRRDRAIDQVMLSVHRAPASYTGEDLVEISCHGGMLVTARVWKLVLRAGARAARPGEFTERAFLNGKST